MSHYPPYGGGPPYAPSYPGNPGYPGYYPPPPGAYTYVPTPVMMPMPGYPPQAPPPPQQENPTYINNYYYQQPQQPQPYQPDQVQVVNNNSAPVLVSEVIDWVPATPSTAYNFSERAYKGGHEGWDGSQLWIIRANINGELVPGKLAIKHRAAFVPHNGKEVSVHNFEILCAQPGSVRWLPCSNGQVPAGGIAAGNTVSAESLYIGRARHMMSLTPGKVHPSHGCCYISYGGNEIPYKNYEVLCKIVG